MNTDQIKGVWHQIKGEAKTQWGKLTDDDLDQVEGNSEKLIGKVQERYGYAREQAEDEVKRFAKGRF
ncbi:MAG: CsbD family protein [Vicinamibacterales bacterium]